MFRQLKKKLGVETSGKVPSATPTSTPTKKRSKTMSTSSGLDDVENDDEDSSPTKKAKKTPRKASKKGSRYIKQEEDDGAAENESDEAGHSVEGLDEGVETEQGCDQTEAEVIGRFFGDEA
jgi:hypothetical protein